VAPAVAVWGVAASLCALWTLIAGKDLNWDLLHYHVYIAHAAVAGRLAQDFFAASAQSYLNPLGYLPFYALVSSNVHSVVVSALFAVVHSLNIGLLYLIAQQLFAHHAARDRAIFSLLAAALGVASAVFWATVGTSFLDPLLSIPMLAGTLLLLDPPPGRASSRAWWAGLLFGAAAALKYSNALFALAACALVAMLPAASAAARGRALLAYAAGGALSVGALAGPSLALLYTEFGNPVFPLFNLWFRAPDFPPINIGAERFAPTDALEALAFPIRMLTPESMTYAEISAPDLRFAALAVLAAAAALSSLLARSAGRPVPGRALAGADGRLLVLLALSYLAWLATSGNGRYGMFVLLLAGPGLARLAERLLPPAPARGVLLVLLTAQIVACALISPTRWFIVDRWSERWLAYAVPERARAEPALYLTVETQTMSAIVPFLHPDSSFVNLRGQHSLELGTHRVTRLAARHSGRVRTLGRALRLQRDGRPRAEFVDLYDATLLRYGYRVDPEDCYAIPWRPRRADALSEFANLVVIEDAGVRPAQLALVSCALRPGTRDPRELAEEKRISALFDRVERLCPGIFRGQTAVTERIGNEWSRSYAGLEASLETRGGALALAPYFKLRHAYLGKPDDWAHGVPPQLEEACRRGLPK